MFTLNLNEDLELNDGNFRITSRLGNLLQLQHLATGEYSTMQVADLPARLKTLPVPDCEVSPHALTHLSKEDLHEVQLWATHLEEMTTGTRPGSDKPRPQYDPATTTLNKRVEAKVDELVGFGLKASRASLMRKKALYVAGGPAALIDRRKHQEVGPMDRADEALIEAIKAVIRSRAYKTTITKRGLHALASAELNRDNTGAPKALPSESTMYRYFETLDVDKHSMGTAAARRSRGNTPKRQFGGTRRFLPGQEVQVDSTPMDVLVQTKTGPQRPTLTIMIDVASRCIVSSTIRLKAAKGYDHALLLAQTMVPYSQRPDRTLHRALIQARRPDLTLLSAARKAELEMSRPFIFPRRIMTDNGKDYLSAVFNSACRKFGIDITRSAVHTPTDKAIVERTFRSINTLFTQTLPGYIGNSTVNRGQEAAQDNLLDVTTLHELFDDWILNVWNHRPHDGLTDSFEPSRVYSPVQFFGAASEYSGIVDLPLTTTDFIDLLPSDDRIIGNNGVEFRNRFYDSPELQPHRGSKSRLKHLGGKWEIKFNPYDIAHIWVRSPENTWIECAWRSSAIVTSPHFAEIQQNLLETTERDETASDHARLEGVPMPTGTSLPYITAVEQPFADLSTIDFDAFDEEKE